MLCPLLGSCQKAVHLKEFLDLCSNMSADAYQKCPHYIEQTKEPRKPADWARILSP